MFRLVKNVFLLVVASDAAGVGRQERWAKPEPHLVLGLTNRVDVAASGDLTVDQVFREALLSKWLIE